jgi:hypothetical protein
MKPRMKKLHEQRDIVVDDCLAVEIGDAKQPLGRVSTSHLVLQVRCERGDSYWVFFLSVAPSPLIRQTHPCDPINFVHRVVARSQ